MDEHYTFRYATLADAELIAQHRRLMFEAMQIGMTTAQFEQAHIPYLRWLRPQLEAGTYIGYLASAGDAVIAGAGMWLMAYPPSPIDLSERRAMLFNVYTHPDHRSQGLARHVVERLIADARIRGIRYIELHASHAGRALYDSLGFTLTNQMRLKL